MPATIALAWSNATRFRPAPGALSDARPLAGYRRKSYAILGHALIIAATVMLIALTAVTWVVLGLLFQFFLLPKVRAVQATP